LLSPFPAVTAHAQTVRVAITNHGPPIADETDDTTGTTFYFDLPVYHRASAARSS
jgi:hypothetical protein